ncbi:MAG: ATP-binding protein [Pseudomonadota bacterium]|nr:ATP-binding protein [Pseudomonadota bacterium]
MRAGWTTESLRVAGTTAAAVVAGLVFATDALLPIHAAVSVLYVLAPTLGSVGRGEGAVLGWTAASAGLAILSFLLTHLPDPDASSTLRLMFALLALGLTAALLLQRQRLNAARCAVEEAEAALRRFTDTVPQFLFRTDADNRVIWINGWFETFTGRDPARTVAERTWTDVLHPEDLARLETRLATRRPEEDLPRLMLRVRRRDGAWRWMAFDRHPERDPDTGEVTGWHGAAMDVHDETEAREEISRLNAELAQLVRDREAALSLAEARYGALLQDLNVAHVELDWTEPVRIVEAAMARGWTDYDAWAEAHPELVERCIAGVRTVSVNDAVAQMLGYEDAAELVAKPSRDNSAEPRRVFERQLRAFFEGRRHFKGDSTLLARDGTRVPTLFGANLMPDGVRTITTFFDLTEQHAAQARVLEAQDELARANRAVTLGALSASIAHELNQPILGMTVDVQTVRRWLGQEPPAVEDALRAVDRLGANAARVSGIVRRTRDQLGKGRREPDAVDLGELLDETARLLARDLDLRGAVLETACALDHPRVLADRIELQQVFVNLIVNAAEAIHAAGVGGRIAARVVGGEDGMIEIIVDDDGPGIAPDLRERLFETFVTTKDGGMGLGLRICRTLVQSAGGDITAGISPAGGAQFVVRLPAAEDEAPGLDAARALPPETPAPLREARG